MSAVAAGVDPDERKTSDDAWLDEALAESFPASDPLPQFHGEDAPPAEPTDDRAPQT